MHYVICYDLENDRLRAKAAKTLAKHGCNRIQKSVFVAPAMVHKDLDRLRADLLRLLEGKNLGAQEGILVIPLADELAQKSFAFGHNNILAEVAPMPLKIIL